MIWVRGKMVVMRERALILRLKRGITTTSSLNGQHEKRIYAWGNGLDGKLGLDSVQSVQQPKEIQMMRNADISMVSCGISHTTALIQHNDSGKLFCWGGNFYGQTGVLEEDMSLFSMDEGEDEILIPTLVKQLLDKNIRKIATGAFHNLAMLSNGDVLSWGGGILGHGTECYDSNPIPIRFFTDHDLIVKDIAAGGDISVALARNANMKQGEKAIDELYVWGYFTTPDGKIQKAILPLLVAHTLKYSISSVTAGWDSRFAVIGNNPQDRESVLFAFGGHNELWKEAVEKQLKYDELTQSFCPTMVDCELVKEVYKHAPTMELPLKDIVVRKCIIAKDSIVILNDKAQLFSAPIRASSELKRLDPHISSNERILDISISGKEDILMVTQQLDGSTRLLKWNVLGREIGDEVANPPVVAPVAGITKLSPGFNHFFMF